jgi:hypothetical protein
MGGNIGAMNKAGRTKSVTHDRNFSEPKNLFNSELQRQVYNQTRMAENINTFFASYHVPLPNTGTYAVNLDEASIAKNISDSRYGGVVNLASLGKKESQIGFSTQNYQSRLPIKLFRAENKTSSSSQTDPMPAGRTESRESNTSSTSTEVPGYSAPTGGVSGTPLNRATASTSLTGFTEFDTQVPSPSTLPSPFKWKKD